MDAKKKAIIAELKRHLAEVRRRGYLGRQLARLRLTTAELAEMIQKRRRG